MIPRPVIASVAAALADVYSHTGISKLANIADVDANRILGSNKEDRCQSLLGLLNKQDSEPPLTVFGRVIEEMMDGEDGVSYPSSLKAARERITGSLLRAGLTYSRGGIVGTGSHPALHQTIEDIAKQRSLAGVHAEFDRIQKNVEADPATSVTAACSLVEAILKAYIEDEPTLTMPSDQSVGPLWKAIKGHLNLEPSGQGNEDLRKILSGLSSIADGLGALRTHHGSAHGRPTVRFRLEPRHARLAANASYTLCAYVIERMEAPKIKSQP
jgi:hypothetical protein